MIQTIMTGGYSCQQVAELASVFIDGEMTGTQWARYRFHLMMCGPCKEYVRTVGLTVDALKDLPGEEGRDMRSQLMAAYDSWRDDQPDDGADSGG